MNTPRVSVVIPAFNAGLTLREAVYSVLDQSFGDLECIVIDDGSTDDTNAVASHLADENSRVCLLLHSGGINRGTAASRNLGMRHSRGEFIAFLDSDDAWLPDKLERQLKVMDSRPDVGFVFGDVYLAIDPDPAVSMAVQPLVRDSFRESMDVMFHADDQAAARVMNLHRAPSNYIPSPTPLVRATLFADGLEFVGPPLLNTMYEDFLMWRILSMRTKFHCLQDPLGIYRVHRDSFTLQFKAKRSVVDHLFGIEEVEHLYWHACSELIDKQWLPIMHENQKTRVVTEAHRVPWKQLPRYLTLARQYGVATEVVRRRIRKGIYDLRLRAFLARKKLLIRLGHGS